MQWFLIEKLHYISMYLHNSCLRSESMDIALPTDATIVFIGRICTSWSDRLTCPRQGRQDGPTCRIQVYQPWVAALDGITEYERLEALYWLHESRRDLVRQSPAQRRHRPRHTLAPHTRAS
jgi:tRNA (Thr-GGU) A37 N-methylase